MTIPQMRALFPFLLGLLLNADPGLAAPPNSKADPASNTAPGSGAGSDVVLPPAPSGATPASAMRLPNLPALGTSDQFAPAAADLPPQDSGTAPAAASAPPPPAAAPPPNSAAASELQKLERRTGLSDAQLAALQVARTRLASGDEAAALSAAQTLTAELDNETRQYVVGDGENLFAIAARPEVYANANLWPLLWWSNLAALREPWQVRKGMPLKVPAHPSIEQISTALNYARTHNVLTAKPDDGDLPAGVVAH